MAAPSFWEACADAPAPGLLGCNMMGGSVYPGGLAFHMLTNDASIDKEALEVWRRQLWDSGAVTPKP